MRSILDFFARSRRKTLSSPWDPEDIRAARARPEPALPLGNLEEVAQRAGPEIMAFLDTKVAPRLGDPLLHFPAPKQDAFLTLPQAGQHYLLGFSSLWRIAHYRDALPGLPPIPWRVVFSASDFAKAAPGFSQMGIVGLIVDRCPFCETVNVLPTSAFDRPESILVFWATQRHTRMKMFDHFLREARAALDAGRAGEALVLAQHVVTHIDAERPEVHLLLGECGVKLGDSALVNRKMEILRLFGEPWPSRLRELSSLKG